MSSTDHQHDGILLSRAELDALLKAAREEGERAERHRVAMARFAGLDEAAVDERRHREAGLRKCRRCAEWVADLDDPCPWGGTHQ